MKPGTKVKMSQKLKAHYIANGSSKHVEEFGECIGIVQGLTDFGHKKGPDIDVRWQPSNLQYIYDPDELDEINKEMKKEFVINDLASLKEAVASLSEQTDLETEICFLWRRTGKDENDSIIIELLDDDYGNTIIGIRIK